MRMLLSPHGPNANARLQSNCAALTLQTPLDHVVSEVPALKQMDIQGDASGYLSSGATPFLTLQ